MAQVSEESDAASKHPTGRACASIACCNVRSRATTESYTKDSCVEVSERAGSRLLLKKGAERIVVHRPHPSPQTGKATVRGIAMFLKSIGVSP